MSPQHLSAPCWQRVCNICLQYFRNIKNDETTNPNFDSLFSYGSPLRTSPNLVDVLFLVSPTYAIFFLGCNSVGTQFFKIWRPCGARFLCLSDLYPFNQISMSNLKERELKKISIEFRLNFNVDFRGTHPSNVLS